MTVQPRPPALTGQLSDLGWTVDHGWTPLQISENENSPTTKKLRYRALSPSEQAFRGSTEHLFFSYTNSKFESLRHTVAEKVVNTPST